MYLLIHAAQRENASLMLVWKMGSGSIFKKIVPDPIFSKSNVHTKSKDLLQFLTFDDVIVFVRSLAFRKNTPPDVLQGIDVVLKKFHLNPKDLKGICVLSGPGQFSFLRSSVVVANTFGWVLGIPVVGVQGDDVMTEREFITQGLKKLSRAKRFHPVVPEYGKEPNITIAKKNI